MSFRTTYILFGILAGVVVIFALALWLTPVTPPDTRYVFPSAHDERSPLTSDDIVRVEIQRKDLPGNIVFARESKEDDFRMAEPAGYRVNSSLVQTLVSQVLGARKVEAADLTDNLAQWGLESPRGKVVLKTAGGKELTMFLGDISGDRLYVTSSDQPETPMAVVKADVDTVFNQVNDFRSRDLFTASYNDIKYVRVQGPKKEPVVVKEESGTWKFVKPKEYGVAAYEGATGPDAGKTPTGMREVVSALSTLRVTDKVADAGEETDGEKKEGKEDGADKKPKTGFVEDNAKDLAKYGLESAEAAELVLEVRNSADAKEGTTVLVGKKVGEDTGLHYARRADEKSVVTVAAKDLEPLRQFYANPGEVRDRDLVRLEEKPDVVRVQYPSGETVDLVNVPEKAGTFPLDKWKLYIGKEQKGLAADARSVSNLITALTGKRVVKEFPTGKTDAELGLVNPNAVVSLWVDGVKEEEKKKPDEEKKKDEKKPEEKKEGEKKSEEKKDDKAKDEKKPADDKAKQGDRPKLRGETPDVVLEFGREDAEGLVAVRRKSGKDLKEVAVLKVPKNVLEMARQDALAYLDKTLQPMVPAGADPVAKVTLDHGGKQTVVVMKDPKNAAAGWVFEKPSELKGRKADAGQISDLTSSLNKLRVQRWKSLKPSDKELAEWGLNAPSLKATLTYTADEKPKEATLLVGKELEDKQSYYAKRGDLDSVFVVSKTDVEALKRPLLDLKVFEFQPSDVKSLKLTGWPRLRMPVTLELERKPAGAWEAKAPAGLKINAGRAEALLGALRDLSAEKFVAFNVDPKQAAEKYGLDVKARALRIEIALEGKEKEPLTLTVGKAEGENVYATSSKFPKDVFLIPKAKASVLGEVKKSSEYLVR